MDNMKNMGGMLKQLRDMQKELVKAQKELAKQKLTVEAAGGAITLTVTGDQKLDQIKISPEFLEANGAANLEKELKKAFNKALEDSREMAQERLGPLSQGLNF